VLAGLFATMLAYTAWTMARRARSPGSSDGVPAEAIAALAAGTAVPDVVLQGTQEPAHPAALGYVASLGGPGYVVRRLPAGIAISVFAGVESALLGVGGGVVKVPAMNLVMGVPLRVAAATSNMMIGVTASASAILYLLRGQVDAYVAGPVVVGVFAGAMATSRIANRVPLHVLRLLFIVVVCWVAVEMAARALAIPIGVPVG